MIIEKNIDLRLHSTMRLGGRASFSATIKSKEDLFEAIRFGNDNGLKIIPIGSGSNVIWRDTGFNGLLLINRIQGLSVEDSGDEVIIRAGAGVNWDELVSKSVELNLTGIESLSLIPGTVGATPIQNVGDYGQEVSDTIVEIECYDLKTNQFSILKNADCDFGYRTSRFKTFDKKKYIITEVTFKLSKDFPILPLYPAVQNYFDDNDIKVTSPQTIRNAVIDIRKNKLPDPSEIANNGSFFSNPIISEHKFNQLQSEFSNIVYWQTEEGKYKIPAAWLIEDVGMKGYDDEETGMSIWPKQAVVFINKSANTTSDLLKFKQKIISLVFDKYGITLEQEPEFLP